MGIFTSVDTPQWAAVWWSIMVGINTINFLVFWYLFSKSRKSDSLEPENAKYKKTVRILGAIYVFVALYRSIFVSSYPNRLTWFDSMTNSPLLIRCFALFAECSFALIVMFVLLQLIKEIPVSGKWTKNAFGRFLMTKTPYLVAVCILTAQFCAYSGLITQYLAFFAVEETLWTIAFLSIFPLVIVQLIHVSKNYEPSLRKWKAFLIVLTIFCTGYLTFQLAFSLPIVYYTQLAADFAKRTF